GPDDLAYLLYTSGSTGGAKGVRITHRNLAYSTHARLGVYGAPVDRFLLLSPFAFDSSVAGIFWTLATGGALVLPAPGEERDVQALGRLIRDHRVTHTLCLPALYGVLLDEVEAEALRSLDTVIVAGEACPPGLPAAHRRLLPEARLFNEYGPTEATVWCVVHQVDDAESGVVPIGRPIPGTGIHLLDPAGRPVPAGMAGELWVTGPGVAQGYWRRPDLDAERFAALDLPDGDLPASGDRAYRTGDLAVADDNGVLTFLGRADGQVKVRGHRIETQGVEAQLLLRPEVAEAAVKVTANQPPRLVGYVVPAPAEGKAPESEPLDVRLDRALRGALPPYLVPDGIQVLRALPRLPNGKVDLRALPEPAAGASQTDDGPPPRDEVEATVARVWGQLLGVDGVGADGHFFRLGGDSILGIRAVSQLRQEGLPVEPRDIAAHPTVAELATALRARRAAGGDPLDDADPAGDPVTGPVPLLPIQRWFLDRGIAAPHHWNLSALFEVPADFDVDAFRQALGAVLGHHDALRARFEQDGDGWRQILDSPSADIPFDVEENGADFDVCAAEVQAGFRLDAGPLLRALYVPRFGDPGRLLIAVHHLVIDAVSWSIVLADLDTAYRQSRAGEAITLPPKTASIARLAEAHLEDGGGGALDDGGTALPFDGAPPSSTEADARTWVQPVDAAPLLEAVGAGAPVDAVLTTALARALGSWIHDSGGSGPLHLDVEGHGRDPDQLQGLDLSRTVGWLTTVRTLVLDLDALEGDPPKAFREVLRILEATPRSAPAPVLFNYLGRNTAVDDDAILRPMPGAEATSRDPRNARSHPLEINASLHGPTLEVRWTYLEGQLGSETVEGLGKGFEAALRGLAAEAAELGDDPSAAAVRLALERAGLDQVDDAFRLTEVQESLLAHHSRATVAGTDDARDTDGGGLLVVRASLEGPLDADHFDLAWGQTVAHHPALRSSIHWRDLPHPVQAVVPEPPFDIHHLDLRAQDPEQQSRDVDTLVAEARRAGLDPELAPVWRLTLVRLGEREHLLIWVCHHLLLDGWSTMAVLGEVLGRYGCLCRGETYAPAAAPELAAVVRWSRDSAPAAEGFWRIFGAEARDVLGAPRLARGSAGGGPAMGQMRRPLELPDRDVRRRAQDLGITPGALFLGCWGLALAEATGSGNATFGLVASGRSAPAAAFPDLGGLVGMLANVVPMRVERILQRSLEDAFGAVFRHQQTVQDYEHLPLPRLFAAGGVALRRSPFDSLVAYANYPAGETTGVPGPSTDLVLRKVQGDLTSAFPLTLSIEPGEPTWVDLRYAEGAFDADAVKALMDRFVALLGAAVQTPVEATVGQMIEAAGVDGPQDGELATAFAGAKPVVEAPARPRGGTGAEAPETATQAQLMRIWNDLVAVQEYGLDDNFFDLGGHSLLVPSLVLRIRVDFGVELPLGLIFQDATVRGLAAAIDAEGDGGDGPTWGPLVPIRPDGDAPPLFMIHGLGGEVGWFYNLANYLAPDLPLYGIQAPPEPQGTLEAMASRYVGEVLAVQGSGPYRLGGYCIGGGVAYEMARQLTAGGRTVELLVLIDSVPQSHAEGRGAPGPTLLARRIRRLLTKDPREMAASVADAARQAAQKLTSRLDRPNPGSGEPAPPELDDVLDMRTLPQVYHDASRRHFAAMRDYRPGPYTGDAWLLRTDDPRFDEDFGWGGLVEGHLGIERVPGRHADVLKEPHVQEVGAKLSAILTGLGDPGDDGGREGDIGGDGPP
ncbi:MAG: condensation domain-containing protein, partial [Acidobacteriota bacterium]